MSRLRGALERRSYPPVDIPDPGVHHGRDPSYGLAGSGFWGQGMVWNGTGSTASTESAMRLSAVYACLRILSEAISTLPLDTFTRQGGVRLPFRPRPEYLSFDPPQLSRIEYLSGVMLSVLTDGNAFVGTPRDALGVPTTLIPLEPTSVQVCRQTADPTAKRPFRKGEVFYEVGDQAYGHTEIMHLKGMAFPGALRGVSPIKAARDVLAGAEKAQEYGINLFDNGAVPPAVIEMDGAPGPDAQQRARDMATVWHETHGGTANAGKVGVLIGAKLNTVAVTPEDASWLDSRRFGIQEIARIYGVPPHLIADSSNSTSWGSGLAEQNLAFGQLSLRPWLERIEEAHGRLLTSHGLRDVFVKLNLDALLRASLSDRYASYKVGIENRFLLPNEARRLEDMPPIPGGDQFPAELVRPATVTPPTAPGGAQ